MLTKIMSFGEALVLATKLKINLFSSVGRYKVWTKKIRFKNGNVWLNVERVGNLVVIDCIMDLNILRNNNLNPSV